jgi:hypothetical protein
VDQETYISARSLTGCQKYRKTDLKNTLIATGKLREARPVAWFPKMLKGELENNSWQLRGLTENRQSDSLNKSLLNLSHGKIKKGDVEVDGVDE